MIPFLSPRLTPTQELYYEAYKSGMSLKEIAELSGVNPATVCRHLQAVRKKLGDKAVDQYDKRIKDIEIQDKE